MDRQPLFLFPELDGPDIFAKIGRNLLPGVQAGAFGSLQSVHGTAASADDESRRRIFYMEPVL
jgi:hypothetical protein